jgi:leucyl-tRNA---protein transferase
MKQNPHHSTRFFYATAPLPCPYMPDRIERRVVTELLGRDVDQLHDTLSQAGFRRSHGIAYAPACPSCNACRAVRTVVEDFVPSRSLRRVARLNEDVRAHEMAPVATAEHFEAFVAYQNSRHDDGDMARMDFSDYRALVEESPVDTMLVEFRDPDDNLAGVCLTDCLSDGLSAVYSFFDPRLSPRSPGTMMILWLIERAREIGLPYVYLGFWIADCSKMSYKDRFMPLEVHSPTGWHSLFPDEEDASGATAPQE